MLFLFKMFLLNLLTTRHFHAKEAKAHLMGNRQKGSGSGYNKIKLISSSKQFKDDEQIQSGSQNTLNEKVCVKSDIDVSSGGNDKPGMKHSHTNFGMSTNNSLDSATSDCGENKMVKESESEMDGNETKQVLGSELLKGDKPEQLNMVADLNTDFSKKRALTLKKENDETRKNEGVRDDCKTLEMKQKDVAKLDSNSACLKTNKYKQENNTISDTAVKNEVQISKGKFSEPPCLTDDMIKTQVVELFPSNNEKRQFRTAELENVEKLELFIKKLNSEEANLAEPLASMLKIIRGQANESVQSELHIAALIKSGFTQKFEQYLTLNNIPTISELEKGDKAKLYWPTIKRFLMLIWISCDQSVNFCQHILASDLFYVLQKDLQRLSVITYTDSDLKTFTVKSILGILHNICRHVPNGKWKLRNDGVVSVVRLYLESEVPMIRLKSFIILSYIISEAENEMINSDDDNFVFIFKVLGDALQSESHKSSKYGMSVVEVMKGLNNLAINDENKIRIVRNGGLALFQAVLESGGSDEIKVTITTLWSLAFHHYNKMKMRELPAIMSKLYELQHCRDEEICHAARGTFWELENISKSSIGSSVSSSLSADKDPSQPHIMISYQWDSQAVMMKVKDRLRHAGYKVWMDIEHMTGSTLEAMALAVEKAAVVLICMSQKYKDSPNCRTEAEYVYRLRKDFVPLRLQKEYIPDGWLGILVGTRLYFDIYSEDQLDVQVPRLTRELRDRGKINPSVDQPDKLRIVPLRMTSREAVPILHHPASPTVSNWTSCDVKQWIISLGLNDYTQNFEEVDGPLLLELQKIQETAPEYFHSILRKDFDITVTKALNLSRCIRQLS